MITNQHNTIKSNGFFVKDNGIYLSFLGEPTHFNKIVLQKRNTTTFITFPFTKDKPLLIKNDMPLSEGIWDVFVDSKYRRIRVVCEGVFDSISDSILCQNKTFSILPYQTVNGNFSLQLSNETVTAYVDSARTTNTHSFISLKIDKPIDNVSFQLIHRKTDESIDVVFQKRTESSVDFWDLSIPNDILLGNWDLYLCEENGKQFEIVIKNSGFPMFFKNDLIIDEEDSVRCILKCYKNKRKGLSLSIKKMNILRDIHYMTLKGDTLHVEGFCFVDGVAFSKEHQRELVVVHRESKKSQRFELPYVYIEQKAKDNTIDNFTYQNSGFSFSISMMDLQKQFEESEGIFDFYLSFSTGEKNFERKLGVQRFDYKKDGFIAYSKKLTSKGYHEFYLSYTPGGNIKIQQFVTSFFRSFIGTLSPLLYYLFFKKRDIWIVGERPNTAQDTGYHFFKYCRTKYPKKEVYYAIDGNSLDIKNIDSYGNVLRFGSFRHYLYTLMASTIISSHDSEYFLPFKGFRFHTYRRANKVFLQHGVLGRKHAEYDFKHYKYPFNLFCVSSEGEKQMVHHKMGYPKKRITVTGLSRFDELNRERQKTNSPTILLIPTWREWLSTDEQFVSSEYFRRYQTLINHPSLQKVLEKYNANLVFYPHYRAQPFIEHFNVSPESRVQIVQLGEENVQQLMKTSDIMITDYSSVSFDFSYMSKPVLFYHFDFRDFFRNGILRPVNETFLGEICTEEKQLIESLETTLENDCREKPWVEEEKHLIFKYSDQQNCERIYHNIVEENTRMNKQSLFKNLVKKITKKTS